MSSYISRNSERKKCVSGTVKYVPHATDFGMKSGTTLWIARIDWNSPMTISRPRCLERTLMKKACSVLSGSKTSIRPTLAQN